MSEPITELERYRQRYSEGHLPWDDPTPPPEVIDLVATLPPGRGLDIGCGYGRTSIYLAQQGWTAVGVDFVHEAIAVAEERAQAAGVTDKISFFTASVTNMRHIDPAFDLAVDVGCMHSLDAAARATYQAELTRLLRPKAWFILFARLLDQESPVEGDWSQVSEQTIFEEFASGFELTRFEKGYSTMPDGSAWTSGWFWFRRR